MQLLHFCYGIGALISPLFAKPFLLEIDDDEDIDDFLHDNNDNNMPLFHASMNDSSLYHSMTGNSSNDHYSLNNQTSILTTMTHATVSPDDLLIIYPYGIISICLLICSGIFTIIRLYFRVNTHVDLHPSRLNDQICQHNSNNHNNDNSNGQHNNNQIIDSTFSNKNNINNTDNQGQLTSSKLPPHVARIIQHSTTSQNASSSSSSSLCNKCRHVRRFTFTNHGNSLSIVSNSSDCKKLPKYSDVFNLNNDDSTSKQSHEIITHKKMDDLHKCDNIGSDNNSKVNSPFSSPFTSPIGSPFATPLMKNKFDHHFRTLSITSGCSQCRPVTNYESPLASRKVNDIISNEIQQTNSSLPSSSSSSSSVERYKMLVVILCGFFMHFYCAVEMTFGSFISPYAVKSDLGMSKKSAAVLSSVFWTSFTFYRLIMVFLVQFLGSRNSVLIDVLLCLISNLFLVPFGDKYEWCLWTGTALMGIGLSAIWASMIGYIGEYMPVTSRIMAVFMITACIGQVVLPAIISPFMESYPKALMWVSLAYSIAMVAFFLAITIVCSWKLPQSSDNKETTTTSH